jgi:hypothetical protein
MLCASASAQDQRDTIEQEYIIAASIDRVWDAFTTKDGIEGFMATHAQVDFRVGGTIQTHYGSDNVIGDPETIRHTILSMIPGRMYSGRVDFPFNDELSEFQQLVMETWGVVEFEELSPHVTLVRLTSCNYATQGAWQQIRAFFNQGNDFVMSKLRLYLDAPDVVAQSDEVMRLLDLMTGGEWNMSQTLDDGRRVSTRTTAERGPDGKTLLVRGWIGGEEPTLWHSELVIWKDPATGLVRLHDVNQNGDITQGLITLQDTSTLSWDWHVTQADGQRARYRVEQHFNDENTYNHKIYIVEDEGERVLVDHVSRRTIGSHPDHEPDDDEGDDAS